MPGAGACPVTRGPGGIGFDINCGVRLLRTDLSGADLRAQADRLADALFAAVPSGLGAHGGRRLSAVELDAVLVDGSGWAHGIGAATDHDLAHTEEGGALTGAALAHVSTRARQRGSDQLGTLGSGSHGSRGHGPPIWVGRWGWPDFTTSRTIRVKQDLRAQLERIGLVTHIGQNRLFATLPVALEAFERRREAETGRHSRRGTPAGTGQGRPRSPQAGPSRPAAASA